MVDLDSTPNKTFSIEDENSFLNNFGTPVQFRKLMEKPATVPPKFQKKLENDFQEIEPSPLNIRQAVRLKLNNSLLKEQNRNDSIGFNSPSFRTKKSLVKNFDSLKLSPVQYGDKHIPKPNKTNFYIESTPNRKVNVNRNTIYNQSFQTENYFTPDKQKAPFDTSPSSNFVWSLKKKKEDAEKRRKEQLELEKTNLETKEERSSRMDQVWKSFQEKIEQFATENRENAIKESNSKIELINTPKQVKESKYSPDLHAAFLARRQRDQELEKKRQQAIAADATPGIAKVQSASTKSLEDKLRDFAKLNEATTLALNELNSVPKSPMTSRLNPNDKRAMGSASRTKLTTVTRTPKAEFATPMSVARARKPPTGDDRSKTTQWR